MHTATRKFLRAPLKLIHRKIENQQKRGANLRAPASQQLKKVPVQVKGAWRRRGMFLERFCGCGFGYFLGLSKERFRNGRNFGVHDHL